MKKKFKIILKSGNNNNYLVTIAIGKKYYNDWQKYSKNNWLRYCKNNSLGLIIVLSDLIDKNNKFWKKPTWQKMLIGDHLSNYCKDVKIRNICYLDTDIVVNPFAPNIFKTWSEKKIGIVSMRINLPYNFIDVRKLIAFFRNKFYSSKYPLDSSLFISLKNLYKYHDLKAQKNECCAGLFLMNLKNHSKIMHRWFFHYDRNVQSITSGGDQTHFNFHVQNEKLDYWLDYRFQASWNYEMAWNYSYLYNNKFCTNENIKNAIESSLIKNYFLHFAGSWPESKMWRTKKIFSDKKKLIFLSKLKKYLSKKVKGLPKGFIKPD